MIRIFIADPNPSTRKALALLLRRRLGTDGVLEVGDLDGLIRNLADEPPDLLLLDWRLFGVPALESCILLQRMHPGLKIVLLSVDAGDEEEAKQAGAVFIHKGASPEGVIAALKPLLEIESSKCVQT